MLEWSDLSEQEQLASIHYDLYKDVYGFRPRYAIDWSVEDLKEEISRLEERLQVVIAEERSAEQEAIVKFEARIAETIAVGAKTRERAIQWIADGEGANGDMEFLCYLCGIPYGYVK